MMDLTLFAQILWTGTAMSSYYVLFTIAFALVLKVVGLWNFAQAGFMGVAFYAMYFAFNSLNFPVWAGLAFGISVTVVLAGLVEVCCLRTLRTRRSSSLTFFIFTLILSEFIAYLLMLLFGTEPITLFPSILSPVRVVANITVSDWDLVALSSTAAFLLALWGFLRFHREGQFLTAVADNGPLAELYGISAKRAYLVAMTIAAVFGCAGMYLFGTRAGVIPTTPVELMLFAVIATLLGGMGRIFSAALAAVVIGLVQSFSVLVIPSAWQNLLLYGFLFFTILIFPRGFRIPRLWPMKGAHLATPPAAKST
jgi:branched-subunit amino acid ABC-type transport system permease component